MGAFDFVSKPVDLAVLRKLVNTALKIRAEEPGEISQAQKRAADGSETVLGKLTGSSEAIKQCKAMIKA